MCPSVKSRKGWVWSVNPLVANDWMVDMSMRITGRLKNGADGMVSTATDDPLPDSTIYM